MCGTPQKKKKGKWGGGAHPMETESNHFVDELRDLVALLQALQMCALPGRALQLRGHLRPHRRKLLQHAQQLVREQLHRAATVSR